MSDGNDNDKNNEVHVSSTQAQRRQIWFDKIDTYEVFARAAHQGDLATVQDMLREGRIHVDGPDTLQYGGYVKALYRASGAGHLGIVQVLIQAGADVNHPSWLNHETALHVACSNARSVEVVEELLKAGANVHIRNIRGETALLRLAQSDNPSSEHKLNIALLLLAAECDVNIKIGNKTPLFQACANSWIDESLFWLIAFSSDLTIRDSKGMTALHLCIQHKVSIDKVRILLESGIDLDAQNHEGETALHMALKLGQLDMILMLLKSNAKILQNCKGRTVLMGILDEYGQASDERISNIQTILTLSNLSSNVCIDFQDENGYTALHYAVQWGSRHLVRDLLELRPDVTLRTHYGKTALHTLTERTGKAAIDALDILRCLVEHTYGYGPLELNLQDLFGRTALHMALIGCKARGFPFLELLANVVDVRIADDLGTTALHMGVYYDPSALTINALVCSARGTPAADMRDCYGNTALHTAIQLGKTDAVGALNRVADPNVPDHEGKTPLHLAVLSNKFEYVVMFLGARKADPSLRDRNGNTALISACKMSTSDEKMQLSTIFHLYKYGVAYGSLLQMI